MVDTPRAESTSGLWLALLVIACLAVIAAPFNLSISPAEEAYGRVVALGSAGKGSSPTVQVTVGDEHLWLGVPYRSNCSVGDRIQIYRHTTLAGMRRYKLGPRACVRASAPRASPR